MYYLRIRGPAGATQGCDALGHETIEVAQRAAEAGAREIVAEAIARGLPAPDETIEIVESDGGAVLCLKFRYIIRLL